MTKFIVSIFALCLSATAFAAQTFDELVQTAITKGIEMPTEAGTYRTLERITPNDRAIAHRAEYFSVVGWNIDGEFRADHLEIVSENWKIDADGNWDIEQWGFVVLLNGKTIRFMHNRLVERQDGRVLIYDGIPTTTAEATAAWDQLLQMWENQPASATLP